MSRREKSPTGSLVAGTALETKAKPAIEKTLIAKAQDAFGIKVKSPFKVNAVKHALAQVKFRSKVTYTCEISKTPVKNQYTVFEPVADVKISLMERESKLLSQPMSLHPLAQNLLQDVPSLFVDPAKKCIKKDSEHHYTKEDCSVCSGQGKCTCARCSGTGTTQCTYCSGSGSSSCMSCFGSGSQTESIHCMTCLGSGKWGDSWCHRCNGRGRYDEQRSCFQCTGGRVTCSICRGSKTERCSSCTSGVVVCAPCAGQGFNTYDYSLMVFAHFSCKAEITQTSDEWMIQAVSASLKAPERGSLFRIDTTGVKSDSPNEFYTTALLDGYEANVTFKGSTSSCQFIGEQFLPYQLNGILSGEFKKTLIGVKDHKKIRKISKSSRTKVARELIIEHAAGKTVERTTPVTRGIVSLEHAQEFINQRTLANEYITARSQKFNLGNVLGLSLPLTLILYVFYALAMRFNSADVALHGPLGIFALLTSPGAVFDSLMYHTILLIKGVGKNPFGVSCVLLLPGYVLNRITMPMLFPSVASWASAGWHRWIFLAPLGSIMFIALFAIFPNLDLMRLSWSGPNSLQDCIVFGIKYLPQLFATAFFFAAICYKAAGTRWARKMRALMEPAKE